MARNPLPTRIHSSRHCLSSIHTHTHLLLHTSSHTQHTPSTTLLLRVAALLCMLTHTQSRARAVIKQPNGAHTHTSSVFQNPSAAAPRLSASTHVDHNTRPTPSSFLLFLLPSLFLFTTGLASRATPQGPTPQEATTWPARCCCRYSPLHSPRPTRRRAIGAYSLARSECRGRGQG